MTSPKVRVILWLGLGLLVIGPAAGGMLKWRESVAQAPELETAQSNEAGGEAAGDMNMIVAADQIEPLKQSATGGDNGAASRLANHYSQRRQAGEETRWLTLAATRGHCGSMSLLRESAERAGDRAGAARWNDMLRQQACTRGKAYPEVSNPDIASMPLWTEQ